MSSFAVSVRTVFFECPLRWFRRPAGASLSRWSSSSALRTRSASAFFSSSKSPSLLKTSFGSRPSRSWSSVSFLIAISALHRRHYGPAHKIPDSPFYRLLKAHDLITSPAYIVIKAADEFRDKTTAPNQLWQTDFTYLKVTGWGWYYLSTVLDDFSRFIVAWKLCATMRATDVTETL